MVPVVTLRVEISMERGVWLNAPPKSLWTEDCVMAARLLDQTGSRRSKSVELRWRNANVVDSHSGVYHERGPIKAGQNGFKGWLPLR